jgi:hypothetical protein
MATKPEQLLELVAQLKMDCRMPIGMPQAFERVCALARSIAGTSPDPAVSSALISVLFKADDLFRRPHLQPEAVLRQMLDDRLYRLEAVIRAAGTEPHVLPIERRSAEAARAEVVGGRRWTDRLAALAIPVSPA